MAVRSKFLLGGLGFAASVMLTMPAVAAADPPPPPPPPPPPNVNAWAPVKPSEFSVMNNTAYGFSTPDGLTCVLQRSGGYGCKGPLPGAPDGANLVSGSAGGVPSFSSVSGAVFGAAKLLPAKSRLSFQTVSCGSDGITTSCVDSRDQAGFVISPSGSFIVGQTNPLLDRPEGTNPFLN